MSLATSINQNLAFLQRKMFFFFGFIGNRLRNFPRLTLGEQVSYVAIGVGLVLILISVALFLVGS